MSRAVSLFRWNLLSHNSSRQVIPVGTTWCSDALHLGWSDITVVTGLCDIPTNGLDSLREGDKHPIYVQQELGTFYLYRCMSQAKFLFFICHSTACFVS